jgi:hypothetical protein
MMLRNLTLTAASLALASGCGSFADDPGEPRPLAELSGQIGNASTSAVPQHLGVALIWGGVETRVVDELQVPPEFPASFTLEIDQPPPEENFLPPMPPFPEGFRIAFGTVVGYEDVNQNGRLDLVDQEATSFIDRVVAENPDLWVSYVEASDEALDAAEALYDNRPIRGLALLRFSVQGGNPHGEFLPLSTGHTLDLSDEPMNDRVMCEGERIYLNGEYPPGGRCEADGSRYIIDPEEPDSTKVCKVYYFGTFERPDPIPANWPCQ